MQLYLYLSVMHLSLSCHQPFNRHCGAQLVTQAIANALEFFCFTYFLLQKLRANFDFRVLDLKIISSSVFQSLGSLNYKLQKRRCAVVQGKAQGFHLPSFCKICLCLILNVLKIYPSYFPLKQAFYPLCPVKQFILIDHYMRFILGHFWQY